MKKLFILMLAVLAIASCSNDDNVINGSSDGNGGTNTSYMAVNLMSSDITGTRAASGYEDGSETENKVTKVRFYFFNGVGGAVSVKMLNGGYVNYYDWVNPVDDDQQTAGTNNDDDIESKLNPIIVINTKEGDKIPQMMVAVLNPTDDLGSESKSLSQLNDGIARDYVKGLTEKGKFVMANSVYEKNGAEISAVPIEAKHLQKTADAAKNNAVTIYVERNVAKVKVGLGDDVKVAADDNGKLALKDKDDNELKVGGKQVYLKLGGWSLTAETAEGRLVKKINPKWTGDWWKSSAQPYRCFWAINAMTTTNKNIYNNYNNIGTKFSTASYTNENAQLKDLNGVDGVVKNHTKVILKGMLCDENGAPFTIVRHLGVHFADEASDNEADNLKELKKSILSQLSANGYNYYSGDATSRSKIAPEDLKIVITSQIENEDSKNNCYVYAQLSDAAEKKTWYTSGDISKTETVAFGVINGKLADKTVVDRALVWKNGMTYYYYVIKHLGNQEGVVRNHIYDTTVTKIAGLGTPVYDPEEVIYPEKPDENDHYIAAQINILSWRLVKNNYELKW